MLAVLLASAAAFQGPALFSASAQASATSPVMYTPFYERADYIEKQALASKGTKRVPAAPTLSRKVGFDWPVENLENAIGS